MVLLRRLLGDTLRRTRQRQQRTLREVSSAARVSLGYLSEIERGQKEASSELLSAICDALDVRLSDVLREVSTALDAELAPAGAPQQTSAKVIVDPVVIERSSLSQAPSPVLPAFEPVGRSVSASVAGFGQPPVTSSRAAVTVAA
jgi:transcriptional regulator with XRE-family HTH domain